jgi:hypothetical protein
VVILWQNNERVRLTLQYWDLPAPTFVFREQGLVLKNDYQASMLQIRDNALTVDE